MESENKKQFNAVIVVEGRDDTKRLKQFFLELKLLKPMVQRYLNKL